MQANEAPQERMSVAWRLHKRGYEPRRGSVMVKTIDATTTDRLRRSPLYLGLSPSCARKRACMENHNMPFPTAPKSLISTFSVPSDIAPLRGSGCVAGGWVFGYVQKVCSFRRIRNF